LINCARGGIFNEAAVIKAFARKTHCRAALDVYEVEPPDFQSRFSN